MIDYSDLKPAPNFFFILQDKMDDVEDGVSVARSGIDTLQCGTVLAAGEVFPEVFLPQMANKGLMRVYLEWQQRIGDKVRNNYRLPVGSKVAFRRCELLPVKKVEGRSVVVVHWKDMVGVQPV